MNLFFDTSALVEYFHLETGSPRVIDLMDDLNNQVWVSDLARIEFISALHRKFRAGVLDALRLQEALSTFDPEWSQMNHYPIDDTVITQADRLMREKARQYGLRALDAIQFASFSLLAEEDWAFVVADGILADVVASEDFTVIRVAL
uniref:PIN domain-containing protein n=1 Tax=Candidatus Kentrum sp. LPFa TaxID=2126335 RepID=A0A450W296_9GAMM|nr:MAG: PIN domain-containing protein [Candidatus Kentron sp. LPFa]VFK30464.1 MAG: PIN domain-containing protein [Candidatus Kentron sp. LPFa]